MALPLRWKIALAFAVLSAVVFVLMYAYVHRAVRASETRQVAESLLTDAHLAAQHVPASAVPTPELERWSRALDATVGARVTAIVADGTVLADSRGASWPITQPASPSGSVSTKALISSRTRR